MIEKLSDLPAPLHDLEHEIWRNRVKIQELIEAVNKLEKNFCVCGKTDCEWKDNKLVNPQSNN